MIARGIGSVHGINAGVLHVSLPGAAIGDGVMVRSRDVTVHGTVSAINNAEITVTPHGAIAGIMPGDTVQSDPDAFMLALGTGVLGRVFDARGVPFDDGLPLHGRMRTTRFMNPATDQRLPVMTPLWTGIRAIDGLLTIGRGARVGVFGGPGTGKSMLLRAFAAGCESDAVVVGLIGERGREAAEWAARRTARTTVVVAPSDLAAAERIQAARVAVAQAHALRSQGLHVLLVIDSLARFGTALREQAISNGEPAGRGGYPPSVFAEMAKLLEAGGAVSRGSVSVIATVLSDGEDEREPLSDAARSLLDGHIMLSSSLSNAGHYPAVDILGSKSRTMSEIIGADHARNASSVRAALAHLNTTADLRSVGMAPRDACALRIEAAEAAIERFLQQNPFPIPAFATLNELRALAQLLGVQ
ncbi:MAG: EscN/YscN/HrcN family type III secretion system ATPase [Candidatus Eremiobacteraeota bacterium]|nr:EscN/YscN/HrcN family type III secretion system ATPase [Candidatus Eremiobacteraeota bacterium]